MVRLGTDSAKRMSYKYNISRGYRKAVEWIALNDEPMETNVHEVSQMLSVIAISVGFGITQKRVAEDVLIIRATEGV